MREPQVKRSLSVVIICLNEADRIAAALESARFADEIVVVDAGSNDGTQALCQAAGARVFELQWLGFVEQRSAAARLATSDALFFLDSDERISEPLQLAIRAHLASPLPWGGARVRRENRYLGVALRFSGWGGQTLTRLCLRGEGEWVGGLVHERLEVQGGTPLLEGALVHDPYRDLGDHLRRARTYAQLKAAQAHAQGRQGSAWLTVLRPLAFFFKRFVLGLGFLDGWRGLVVCSVGAWGVWLTWAQIKRLGAASEATGCASR